MIFASAPLVLAAWLGVALMGGYLLHVGSGVLIPFALAVLIWQLINAASERFDRVRIAGRALSRWQRLLIGIALAVLALWLFANLVLSNVGAVSASAPTLEANLIALLPRIARLFGLPPPESVAELMAQLDIDVMIRGIAATLAGFVGSLGLVALYVAFMLFEQDTFERKIVRLSGDPVRAETARGVLVDIERRVERYLWIKSLTSLLTAFLSWVVLALIGCQNASFWAVIIFFINFIPVVGSMVGAVFPSLLLLVQFGSFGVFFLGLFCLTVVQIGVGNILEPRLMGRSLNLSPIAILVALAVWGGLWGVAGMFLCVPITVIVMIVCAHFEATRPFAVLLSADGDVGSGIGPAQATPPGAMAPAASRPAAF